MGRVPVVLAVAIVGVLAGGIVTLVLEAGDGAGDGPADVADYAPTEDAPTEDASPGPAEPGAGDEPGTGAGDAPTPDVDREGPAEPEAPGGGAEDAPEAADREVADRGGDGRLPRTGGGAALVAAGVLLGGTGLAGGLAGRAGRRPGVPEPGR